MTQYIRINPDDYSDIEEFAKEENFWRIRFYIASVIRIVAIIISLFLLINFSWLKLCLTLLLIVILSLIKFFLYRKAVFYRDKIVKIAEKQFNLAFKSCEALKDVYVKLNFLHSDSESFSFDFKSSDSMLTDRKLFSVIEPTIEMLEYAIGKKIEIRLNRNKIIF